MEKTVRRHREGTTGRQRIRVMHPRPKRHLRPPMDGGEAWNHPSQDLPRECGPVTPWVSGFQRCGTECFCCSGPPRLWSFARQSQETIHILSPPLLHTQSPSSGSETVLPWFLPPSAWAGLTTSRGASPATSSPASPTCRCARRSFCRAWLRLLHSVVNRRKQHFTSHVLELSWGRRR